MATWNFAVVLLALPLAGVAASSSWIDDAELKKGALAKRAETPPRFTVDLDLAPKQRWAHLVSSPIFRNAPTDIKAYFKAMIPDWLYKLVEEAAYHLRDHFASDYAEEIESIEAALGLKGDIAVMNLAYTLEQIGVTNCTQKNTTGPCLPARKGPGLCTSFVAETPDGSIWHGRNMDWNLPDVLRKYIIDVDFTRGNRTVFSGTTIAGVVGLLHGMRNGSWSISLNARDDGGSAVSNFLEWLADKSSQVSIHAIRRALEQDSDFETAVTTLSKQRLAEHVYFIVGGTKHGEGAILSRDRFKTVDIWRLGNDHGTHEGANNTQPDWFRLQTNYDHWVEAPKWDDRRTPGVANLQALGQMQLGTETILNNVLRAWPTLNDHTDITAVLSAAGGEYRSIVWREAKGNAAPDSLGRIII